MWRSGCPGPVDQARSTIVAGGTLTAWVVIQLVKQRQRGHRYRHQQFENCRKDDQAGLPKCQKSSLLRIEGVHREVKGR